MQAVNGGTLSQAQATGVITLVGVSVNGLKLDNVQILLGGSGTKILNCTITGATTIGFTAGASGNEIAHNTFAGTLNYAVYGYPGNGNNIHHNSVDLRKVASPGKDGTEWLHFLGDCDGLVVRNNVIIAPQLRWAIELQNGMTNLQVQNNYVLCTSGSGLSLAIGGDATAPFAHAGEYVDVSGNVVIATANPFTTCALEIDGDKNISVHDNYFSGFAWGITNGTGGQAGQGLHTSNNTIIYGTAAYADGDNTPWATPPRVSQADKLFKLGDASAPKPPAMPTDVGAGSATASPQIIVAKSPTPVLPTIALGLKATSTINAIAWSWNKQNVPATLALVTPGDGKTIGTIKIPAGTTTITTMGLAANWVVNATLATAAGQQTLAAQCLAKAGNQASAAPISTPATVSAVIAADMAAVTSAQAALTGAQQQLSSDLKAGK